MEARITTSAINDTTRMDPNHGGGLSTALLALGFTLSLGLAGAATADAQEPEIVPGNYVQAKDGAVVRNFRDEKGKAVTDLKAGALLMVHAKDRNFYEVSSPTGFPVWVFGKYLSETGTQGVLKVIGSGVRMRPLPESSVDSYPLSTKLNRDDLVQFIERADPNLSFDADWIHVWSVPHAHAWVSSTEVDASSDQEAASQEWTQSLRGLVDVPLAVTPAAAGGSGGAAQNPTSRAAVKIPEEAYRSLAYGKTLLKGAVKKGKEAVEADFESCIRAFNTVLDMVPDSSIVAAEANAKLNEARTHQTVAAVRSELAAAEVRQEEMVADWAEAQRLAELERTAHWGRFMGRGWVEKMGRDDEARYYLRWGGEVVFEISCDSGRYDLDLFQGYELGVRGTTLRAASMATDDTPAEVALLDVSRVEVISGSPLK